MTRRVVCVSARKHEALPIAPLYLRVFFIQRGYLPRELNISSIAATRVGKVQCNVMRVIKTTHYIRLR